MKKFIYTYGLLILSVFFFSSCLTAGLDDLPNFEDAEITDVKFEFRYKDPKDKWIDGEPIVKLKNLTVNNKSINKETLEITCSLTVPDADDTFTEDIRQQVSLTSIVGKFNISSGAAIAPVDNSPTLGIPGDFSGTCKYKVTAANKSSKVWTVKITSLDK